MPKCSFGNACNRKGCVYTHPPKPKITSTASTIPPSQNPTNKICMNYLSQRCTFWHRCLNFHPPTTLACDTLRRDFKLKQCTWGASCQTEGCLYRHPVDDLVSEEPSVSVSKLSDSLLEAKSGDSDHIPLNDNNNNSTPPPVKVTYPQWLDSGCILPPNVSKYIFFDSATKIQRSFSDVYASLFPPTTTLPTSIPPPAPPPAPPQQQQQEIARIPLPPSFKKTTIADNTKRMPDELWQDSIQRENFFSVADPFERYELVNSQHKMKSQRIVDLHFQSTKTVSERIGGGGGGCSKK